VCVCVCVCGVCGVFVVFVVFVVCVRCVCVCVCLKTEIPLTQLFIKTTIRCHFGSISRDTAESLLERRELGTYLFRESESRSGCSLSLR